MVGTILSLTNLSSTYTTSISCAPHVYPQCQDWFSSMILLGGPGVQGTNEEVSPDTSRCSLVWTVKSRSYRRSLGTREALGVSPGFAE